MCSKLSLFANLCVFRPLHVSLSGSLDEILTPCKPDTAPRRDADIGRWRELLALPDVGSEEPEKERRLKMRLSSGQQLGMLATRMAVLASRMYQNVQMGLKGSVKE